MGVLTESRLREMWRRQAPGKWGQDYEPAIKVTRKEAPRTSRPSILWSDRLGRQIHVMSKAELIVAILLQYSDNVFEIHEQKILPTGPEQHPLHEHFAALGIDAPSTRGTVAIAESLGCLGQHPIIYVDDCPVPYNYINDFLVFCIDESGPFCVNISVKNTQSAFSRKHGQIVSVGSRATKANTRESNRHQIEEVLFKELGIKTVFFAADRIEKKLAYNLTHLYKWHARPVSISEDSRIHVVERFKACLAEGRIPLHISKMICHEMSISEYEIKAIFFQSVWRREIKPDLYECVQFDTVMSEERRNPLVEFSELFSRPQ